MTVDYTQILDVTMTIQNQAEKFYRSAIVFHEASPDPQIARTISLGSS